MYPPVEPQYNSRASCAWGEASREFWMAVRHKDTSAADKYLETAMFPLLVLDRYVNSQLDEGTNRWFHLRTGESFGFRPPYSVCPGPSE